MPRLVVILILAAQYLLAAATFDIAADFSLEKNPNNPWHYGYSATNSLDPSEFRLSEFADQSRPIGFWHPSAVERPGPGYYPYIARNADARTRVHSSNGWAVRAGQIAMEGSNTGQYSIVRFVAPASGTYELTARYEGIHYGLSSTDVHVLHNAKSLFQADIEGYGGDPAFHEAQGSSPAASYATRIELQANDIITFAVGYGKNKTHFCDTTGLSARITMLSSE
jgi:hypothetical protein